jgi:hypothetical protein
MSHGETPISSPTRAPSPSSRNKPSISKSRENEARAPRCGDVAAVWYIFDGSQ